MAWSWGLDADTVEHAGRLQLTDTEATLLAKLAYVESQGGGFTIAESLDRQQYGTAQWEAYQSLCRMAYIVARTPREVRHAATVDMLSPDAHVRLNGRRPYSYQCCEFAITLPCVCHERTFCPVHGGGCHGTHD